MHSLPFSGKRRWVWSTVRLRESVKANRKSVSPVCADRQGEILHTWCNFSKQQSREESSQNHSAPCRELLLSGSLHPLPHAIRPESLSEQCNFSFQFLDFFFFLRQGFTFYPRLDLNLGKYITFEEIIQTFKTYIEFMYTPSSKSTCKVYMFWPCSPGLIHRAHSQTTPEQQFLPQEMGEAPQRLWPSCCSF